jgi:hypothetical protein
VGGFERKFHFWGGWGKKGFEIAIKKQISPKEKTLILNVPQASFYLFLNAFLRCPLKNFYLWVPLGSSFKEKRIWFRKKKVTFSLLKQRGKGFLFMIY